MAIYQDIQGDQAGGKLPYLQGPAHASPSRVHADRVQFAASTKRLGIALSGMSTSAIKHRERKEAEAKRERYEQHQALDEREVVRRNYHNTSKALSINAWKSDFYKRAHTFKETLDGTDASTQFREWVANEISYFDVDAYDTDSISDPFLKSLVDEDVIPNASKSLALEKGYVTWEEATGNDKVRLITGMKQDLIKWASAEEATLLDVELKAAHKKNSEGLVNLWNTFFLDTQDGNADLSTNQLDSFLTANYDLHKNDPEAWMPHSNKMLLEGISQIGLGVSKETGVILSNISNQQLWDESGNLTDVSTNWVEQVKTKGGNDIVTQTRHAILEQVANLDNSLDKLKPWGVAGGAKGIEAFQKGTQVTRTAITESIIFAINNASAQMAPMTVQDYNNVSAESIATESEGPSFGQFVVSDPAFINLVTPYIGQQNATRLRGSKYHSNLSLSSKKQNVPNNLVDPENPNVDDVTKFHTPLK